MSAQVLPINQMAEAIRRKIIDGATSPAVVLVDFGIARDKVIYTPGRGWLVYDGRRWLRPGQCERCRLDMDRTAQSFEGRLQNTLALCRMGMNCPGDVLEP